MIIPLTAKTWTKIPVQNTARIYQLTSGSVAYAESISEPAVFDSTVSITANTNTPADNLLIRKPNDSFLWAYAINSDCLLSFVEDGPGSQEVTLSKRALRTITEPFGRLAVASPKTLFDGKMTYGIPETYDKLEINGATVTASPDLSGATMAVTATPGSRAVLQIAEYTQYQAGNGHEANITYGDLVDLNGSCEFRAGYFDDENGAFISYKDGSVSAVLRSSVSGSPVDDVIPQSSWNIDPLDGSGPSGVTLDTIARQILVPDLEWLSVGTVQLTFTIDRIKVPFHAFHNANKSPGAAYMTTADLPVRWELIGDGSLSSSVVAQCCSVKSYGGEDTPTGFPFTKASDWAPISETPSLLLALRPAATFEGKDNHVKFNFQDAPQLAGLESMEVQVIYNPTISGAAWSAVDAKSAMEFTKTGTVTGGTITKTLLTPSGSGQSRSGTSSTLSSKLPFTLRIDGTVDSIALVAFSADGAGAGNGKVAVNWEEVR